MENQASWMTGRIRTIAICIIKREDGSILVSEGHDSVKRETFYRPLGGTVEFGETGYEAVARELREEIGADLRNIEFLGTIENIFTFEGNAGHEIVLVYAAELKEPEFYGKEVIEGLEEFPGGSLPIQAVWKPLESFQSRELVLYPEKLLPLLESIQPATSDNSRTSAAS